MRASIDAGDPSTPTMTGDPGLFCMALVRSVTSVSADKPTVRVGASGSVMEQASWLRAESSPGVVYCWPDVKAFVPPDSLLLADSTTRRAAKPVSEATVTAISIPADR